MAGSAWAECSLTAAVRPMEVGSADSGGADYAVEIVRGPSAVQAASSNPVVLTASSRPHPAGGAGSALSSGPVDRWAESFD